MTSRQQIYLTPIVIYSVTVVHLGYKPPNPAPPPFISLESIGKEIRICHVSAMIRNITLCLRLKMSNPKRLTKEKGIPQCQQLGLVFSKEKAYLKSNPRNMSTSVWWNKAHQKLLYGDLNSLCSLRTSGIKTRYLIRDRLSKSWPFWLTVKVHFILFKPNRWPSVKRD